MNWSGVRFLRAYDLYIAVDIKRSIRERAWELGLPVIGFTPAEPLPEIEAILERRREQGYASPFEETDVNLRTDPRALMSEARTIVVFATPYNSWKVSKGADHDLRGRVSNTAWGTDYHIALERKGEELAKHLKHLAPNSVQRVFVDAEPLVERAYASRAGVGWIGKNCSLITPSHGSLVFLGLILTSLEIEPDPPVAGECGSCRLCLDACPTGALVEPYVANSSICLSQVTQMRGFIPVTLREKMGDRLYGCDSCTDVCPYSLKLDATEVEEFLPEKGPGERPLLSTVLSLTNKQFKESWGKTAAGWRGRTVFQRNAIIALGNSGRSDAVPLLIDALRDARPVIRGCAAWSLARIREAGALQVLEGALGRERDSEAFAEMRSAIAALRKQLVH